MSESNKPAPSGETRGTPEKVCDWKADGWTIDPKILGEIEDDPRVRAEGDPGLEMVEAILLAADWEPLAPEATTKEPPDLCCQAKYGKYCDGACTCIICEPALQEREAESRPICTVCCGELVTMQYCKACEARPVQQPAQIIAAQQAEDEGLWCIPQTVMEAHLQKELRRLTEAVEGKTSAECLRELLLKSRVQQPAPELEFCEHKVAKVPGLTCGACIANAAHKQEFEREDHQVAPGEAVGRAEDEVIITLHTHVHELQQEIEKLEETVSTLRRERDQLSDWKESAMRQLTKQDALRKVLTRPEYLGRDIYEASADLLSKLESQVRELTAERDTDRKDWLAGKESIQRRNRELRAAVEKLTAQNQELRGEKAKEIAAMMLPEEISRATQLAKLMYNADHFKLAYEDHLKICPGPPMLLPSCYIEQNKTIAELRDTVEKMQKVLEQMLASASPNPKEHPTMTVAWANARRELSDMRKGSL